MANNPLQQFFRQPKIYVKLPTNGVYTKPGMINGDPSKLAIFGMTGMDEILMKTPDALLSGESITRVIASCCPSINDPWEISNIDVDCLLTAIRIATYGNKIAINHQCKTCEAENEYDIDLGHAIEHYSNVSFQSTIELQDFTIAIRPLNFKEANGFNIENFQLQRQLAQLDSLSTDEEKAELVKVIFEKMGEVQRRVLLTAVESVQLPTQVVTEKNYIKEFLDNCDREVFAKIKGKFDENTKIWNVPSTPVKCSDCGAEDTIAVELNQSNFFEDA